MQMFMCNRSQENVVLRARKGFVRAAVEEGLDGGIVPVFHFGNSQVQGAAEFGVGWVLFDGGIVYVFHFGNSQVHGCVRGEGEDALGNKP